MTSTFPANSNVIAFCQEIIRSGSYEAFSRSVAFILEQIFQIRRAFVKGFQAETLVITGSYESVTMSGCSRRNTRRNTILDVSFGRWDHALWRSAAEWIAPT